jgi:UDP-N-acetylglucosamine--N-acetylmuramyl-(pentapeptide) pyrophosphoryl-undecaprenol N-acetylglucosamine transferase
VRQQKDLSPEILADIITEMAGDPAKSAAMAAAAKAAGKRRAASLLADLTEAIAGGKSVAQFTKEVHT